MSAKAPTKPGGYGEEEISGKDQWRSIAGESLRSNRRERAKAEKQNEPNEHEQQKPDTTENVKLFGGTGKKENERIRGVWSYSVQYICVRGHRESTNDAEKRPRDSARRRG